MAAEYQSPVFLLTFANEQPQSAYYLRSLAQELRRLRATLEQTRSTYQLVFYPNMTVEELLQALRTYRHRIALLHYGGHSNSYSLLLQSADGQPTVAHSGGLAKLLAQQHGLRLVFLNGCANEAQAQALLDAGIAVVVATSTLIDDQVAMHFADQFYASLAADATIAEAFEQAAAVVELHYGADSRHLYHAADDAATAVVPWRLYRRDEAAVAWRLADLSNDPCWGLPPLPPMDRPAQPFRYLSWFRSTHAEIFFGRGQEIRTLYEHIDDPTGAPILLLYGQSGVGKSSLLEAGLLPRLATAYMPYYVRRDRSLGLSQSLAAALCARTTNRTIIDTWRDHEQIAQKPVVVILDQVEEIFTRPQSVVTADTAQATTVPVAQGLPTEMAEFLCTLRQLFRDRSQRPQGKLILGFRKEYLAEIEKRLGDEELPYSKFFLEPLNKRGIIEAITGVTRSRRLQTHYGLTVEDGLPALIADQLLQDTNAPLAPTLQILLAKLWERAVAANHSQPRFDQALYRALQKNGILLRDFFEQSLQALAAVDAEAVNSGLLLDLLAYHTTPWGSAEQHSRAALVQRYPYLTEERLAQLIQGCKDHYLLTDPADNQTQPAGVPAASCLAHDALAPLVRERFARSEAPGQRARRLLENCVSEWRHDPQTTRLDDNELALVEQHQAHMRVWTADEQALVTASKAARAIRHQQAEQQRVNQHRQRRLRQILITLIGVTSLVIGIQSLGRQRLADDNRRQESAWWSEQARQQLTQDPVASITLAHRALPSLAQPKPYVPEAEFSLRQAMNNSLERVYQPVVPTSLTAQRVAIGRDWIAVGGPGLRLLPYNLSPVITMTIMPSSTTPPTVTAVSWNNAADTLLSQEAQVLRLWKDSHQIGLATFTEPIACAEWQPTATNIVVCTGHEVALWRGEQQPTPLFRFIDKARDAHWSPDGRWLVAWDAPSMANQQLILWDNQTAQVAVQEEAPATLEILKAVWAPGSQHLVLSDNTGHLQIRQMGVDGVVQIAHQQPIKQIEFIDQGRFLTWGIGDVVRLWSITGTLLQTFGYAEDNIQGFCLSPDQTDLLVLQSDGTAWRYDLTRAGPPRKFAGHEKTILAVAWHAHGQYVATSAMDGTARVWERATGKLLITLRGHTGTAIPGRADVLGVLWQPDDRLLTYGEDGSFRLWAIFDQQGLPLCVGEDQDGQPRCHATAQSYVQALPLLSAHWLDHDTIITVDEDSRVRRLTSTTGNVQTICTGADEYTDMARVTTPEQRRLFFFRQEGRGRVCDLTDGQWTSHLAGPITAAQWIGDQLLISRAGGVVQVVDATSGAVVTTLQGLTTTVAAAINSSGQLATATTTGLIQIWTLPSGTLETTLGADLPAGQRGELTELTWSGDGKQVLATGSEVRLWQVATGQATIVEASQPLPWEGAQMSVDQQWVAVSAGPTLRIRRAADGVKQWQRDHEETIQGMAWFTGVRWSHEHRYPPAVARLVRWLTGGPWTVSSTRQLLLTWSGDGTARLWDAETATELMRMVDSGYITLAALSPDGAQLFTVNEPITSEDGSTVLRVWPLWSQAPDALLAAAQKSITRPFTATQTAAFSLTAP